MIRSGVGRQRAGGGAVLSRLLEAPASDTSPGYLYVREKVQNVKIKPTCIIPFSTATTNNSGLVHTERSLFSSLFWKFKHTAPAPVPVLLIGGFRAGEGQITGQGRNTERLFYINPLPSTKNYLNSSLDEAGNDLISSH